MQYLKPNQINDTQTLKVVSLNPDRHHFRNLSDLISEYAEYVHICKNQAQKEPTLIKSFEEWLLTEI